jgi:hypothetical protein
MHDLHQGRVTLECDYMNKMGLSVRNGGLWGDFTILLWVSQSMECPIFVWNKHNGRIMLKCGKYFPSATIQLVFGDAHYEPIVSCA